MSAITRIIDGAQVTFTAGGVPTSLSTQTLTFQPHYITSTAYFRTVSDSLLFHYYCGTQVQRDLTELTGPVERIWQLSAKLPEGTWAVQFQRVEHALKARAKYMLASQSFARIEILARKFVTDRIATAIERVLKTAGKGHEREFSWRWMTRDFNGNSMLAVYSNDGVLLADVRKQISALYQGHIACTEAGSALWVESLQDPWFEELGSRNGKALVMADRKYNVVRIYPPARNAASRIRAIEAELEQKLIESITRRLYYSTLPPFIPETMDRLNKTFRNIGAMNRAFPELKIKANGRRLTIRLTEQESKGINVASIIGVPPFLPDTTASPPFQQQYCPICDDPTTDIPLGCGHTYCTDCFTQQYETATSDTTSSTQTPTFPLRCWAHDCEKPMSLPHLQRHMPYQTFNALLEAALKAHIRTNANAYRYCATPDCVAAYAVAPPLTSTTLVPQRPNVDRSSPYVHTCPCCLTLTCPSCKARPHPQQTCATSAQRNARTFFVYAAEEGREVAMKTCPQCEVVVDKVEGCSHMRCVCGGHWCWLCQFLGSKIEVVAHLQAEHGGLYGRGEWTGLTAGRLPTRGKGL
ncbi:hypothetical protein BDW02DRAFT_632458 [Decorospora gaudefroyi]|uniref:RBR-type E3 ubiquitin transferase n=1 Tax=Decorospora gaudefroyi TaxID=184978 RepID=A0A6A5KAV0_9PLEO|nr:hypothetical protein BDW02DRAFT_632458 [Decorospora gaudefroyi]